MTIKYKVIWDNGSACDSFKELFDTEELAKMAGEDWWAEMVAIDDNPKEAEEAYSYEVIEVEVPEPEDYDALETPRSMGWVGQDGLP